MMSASMENPPDCLMWHDALNAKYDGVGEFGRKEWDQLLGDCQVILILGRKYHMLKTTNMSLGCLRLARLRFRQGTDRSLPQRKGHSDHP
jgi:hypothetical protein